MKNMILFLLFFVMANVANSQDPYCKLPIIIFDTRYIQVKDTVFVLHVYETNGRVDSIVYHGKKTRLSKRKWIGQQDSDGAYAVSKFKKIKPLPWFKESNGILFQADYEVDSYSSRVFYPDGTVYKRRQIGMFIFTKIIRPKKKE